VCGKVNFTNLSRYSDLNEKTYRRHFSETFAFTQFNIELVQAARTPGHSLLAVMDCSFITKSGKNTDGIDYYWNGCHSRVERGLEISVMGLVDVATETAYAVSAQQTLNSSAFPVEVSRMAQYLYHLQTVRPALPPEVRYLAVDGAYAKQSFVSETVRLNLHLISKLRCDANLRYRYEGVQNRRGRPRKYDGKVDLQDLTRLTFVETVQPKLDLYTVVVWSVAFKRWIRLAYLLDRQDSKKLRFVVLFSTDVEQTAPAIYQFYRLRFQVEFIFRNAKQFTGLQDCQARDAAKLDFQFNASLTALNLALLDAQAQHNGEQPFVFSMASMKRRALMQHLLERFIVELDLEPTVIKSHPNYQNLQNYGMIAA
jgi:hypothetical protein